MSENNIMVSVCMITYNHETYISEAIEGVIMQQTSFPIELIIGEDCSTDNTRAICLEYKKKYSEIIKLRLPEKNLGVIPNFTETLNAGSGKYIAICEGDDYWTNPYKLQKQVEFMEKNQKYSFCFHNATISYIDKNITQDFHSKLKSKSYNTNELLLKDWFIPTASILLKASLLPDPFPKWYSKVYNGDYGLELLLSTGGDFYYMHENMCVYRKNAINSLSVNGLNGAEFLKKKLFLLKEFKNTYKNNIAIIFAISRVRYNLLKVYLYINLPFIVTLKNKFYKD